MCTCADAIAAGVLCLMLGLACGALFMAWRGR